MSDANQPAGAPGGYEDDAALVKALKRGDDRAFEHLVRHHAAPLLAVARRYLRNEEDARDAVQETFAAAYKALDGFDGRSKLTTWLYSIAINASLMKLRSRKRKPEQPIEDLLPRYREDGHIVEPYDPWQAGADELIHREDVRRLVRRSIDELPESYRNVLLLRDIEGLDTEETARILDATPNAVKIRLHRARQALRTLLDPHLREGRL